MLFWNVGYLSLGLDDKMWKYAGSPGPQSVQLWVKSLATRSAMLRRLGLTAFANVPPIRTLVRGRFLTVEEARTGIHS